MTMTTEIRKLFAISFPKPATWLGAAIVSMWLAIPPIVITYMILATLDWVIGAVNAAIKGKFCVRTSLEGLWRKLVTLILIGVAHRMIEPLGVPPAVFGTIALAFVVNELISVVMNAADAGVWIPGPLVDLLAKARKLTGGNGKSGVEVRRAIDRSAKAGE